MAVRGRRGLRFADTLQGKFHSGIFKKETIFLRTGSNLVPDISLSSLNGRHAIDSLIAAAF